MVDRVRSLPAHEFEHGVGALVAMGRDEVVLADQKITLV